MEEDASSMVSNAKMYVHGETSDSNNSSFTTLPPGKRMRNDHHLHLQHRHQYHNRNNNNSNSNSNRDNYSNVSAVKFKGVVPQQNGHWGAQIYANHQRIWLGTFKSEKEAAMAYDSAAIKIRGNDSHRNFPWTDSNNHEPNFQNQFTTEAVLNMIKDGTYQPKFASFLRNLSQREYQNYSGGGTASLNQIMVQGDEKFSCRQLFQKELTPSDVGKLNRLVIPKKYAVKYFPYISENEEENNALNGGVDDVELGFFDKQMKPWNFRYCFWRSSQSFVFTRGWNRFVKEKKLKEKDIITFYRCEGTNSNEEKEGEIFFLVDVIQHDELGLETQLQLEQNNSNAGKINNFSYNSKLGLRDYDHKKKKTASNFDHESEGIRLFGVQIRR
ncbi:AP2/ERF and B3 domain-containing transcription factor At1g50680-like [Mangifera indica]|uniref:AP2/ERF and B3 domain-containing transcription factor At1g50680-like n=1 Tax=Mangifera indica TaxID=29780 RepID=UPI001CFA6503|nr:AP2/ERF and B3 domain-containing transcription factor At1g50680-like [Mangifera indica]